MRCDLKTVISQPTKSDLSPRPTACQTVFLGTVTRLQIQHKASSLFGKGGAVYKSHIKNSNCCTAGKKVVATKPPVTDGGTVRQLWNRPKAASLFRMRTTHASRLRIHKLCSSHERTSSSIFLQLPIFERCKAAGGTQNFCQSRYRLTVST